MPKIDTQHRLYKARVNEWARCRDALDGEDAVKAAGPTYLPQLGGQEPNEYDAYKKRGYFMPAMERTVQGLSGAVFRKDPITNARDDESTQAFLADATGEKESLNAFSQRFLNEGLGLGRVGVLVTMDQLEAPDNMPHLILVAGENIINWDDNGQWIVLKEEGPKVLFSGPDEVPDMFVQEKVEQYRLLQLIEGQYTVSIWQEKPDSADDQGSGKEFVVVEGPLTPLRQEQPLDFIPFYVINGNQRGLTPVKPPLLGLADASFDHYRLITDYRHGLHWTALPTPLLMGFDTDEGVKMGSGTALVSENTDADGKMLEFQGQGLSALKEAIEAVVQYMGSLGSRLLEQQKKAVEAAETHRLRVNAEHTTVQTITLTASEILTDAVQTALWWRGVEDENFKHELNTDLAGANADPTMLTALHTAYIAGSISFETWYHRLQEMDLTEDDIDAETEQARIGDRQGEEVFSLAAG